MSKSYNVVKMTRGKNWYFKDDTCERGVVMSMQAACAFGSVAVVAFVAFVAVLELGGTGGFHIVHPSVTPSYALVDCAPPPPPSATGNSSDFRAKLIPLLAALPAAAAPYGFASLHSDDHSAFVRGICLGFDLLKDCHACLAAAADNLTGACGASRRAGVWSSESCFVAYADASTSSAREDAFRHIVWSGEDPGQVGPNCFDMRRLVALAQSMAQRGAKVFAALEYMDASALARDGTGTGKNTVRLFPDVARVETRVRVVAQCARDRAAECARCLGDAARRVSPCSWGLDGAHARVADVVGYGCFLRIETSVPPHVVATTSPTKPLAIVLLVLTMLSALAALIAIAAADAGH